MSAFEDGRRWAAEAFFAGMPISEIEAYIDEGGIDPTSFDAGAREELRELEAK